MGQQDEIFYSGGRLGSNSWRRSSKKLWIAIFGCALVLMGIYLNFNVLARNKIALGPGVSPPFQEEPLQQCPSPLPPPAKPPVSRNLWASLTIPETADIQAWLEAPERNLNLTRASTAALSDNSIFLIESYYPSKADSLAYLSSPNTTSPPDRYARVTIHEGARLEPAVVDYLIGPLPVGAKTTMRKLTEIYHREEVPYNARGINWIWEFAHLLVHLQEPYAEAMLDLFGAVARGDANDTLIAGLGGPFSFDGSFRRVWLNWRKNVPGMWLHPINFFQYIDTTGTDPAQWKILKIVYNNQLFSSTEDFLSAWKNGTLIRHRLPDPSTEDLSWTTRKKTGVQRDLDHLPGPRSVSFAGLRFRVDRESQYVSWMGWSMYLGFDRDMGLSLWDIRFKNERIIYQLAPQEALAQYAGNDPFQTTTAWLDRYFGMGSAARDMLPGYDCPHEAVYLPATTYSSIGSIVRQRAICIFEQDSGKPVSRHTGFKDGEFGAVKGFILTIRSITTLGNYDYLFDYIFHLDGTIEVRVSASGYLQGGYWEPAQDGYGGRIGDTTMGNLHDHVINFKVDFDIAGLDNSLLHTSTSQEEVERPWFDDDWGSTVIQQKITKTFIENEDDAKLRYPPNFQGSYAIVNRDQKNKWGYPRGYSVHPGYSPVHNTVVGSKRVLNNANWARYNLAVSKRKDTEPSSSSMWNLNLPGAPMVDFHKFFDGENITQQDLVMWINVGTHHLPQAEDAPNTKANIATSSFMLTPLNYFDSDVSLESINAILLNMPKSPGDSFTFDDYGVKQEFTCIPEQPPPFEYGDIVMYDTDGKKRPPLSVEEMRRDAELFHGIKLEL